LRIRPLMVFPPSDKITCVLKSASFFNERAELLKVFIIL